MNFYELSGELNIEVKFLFERYKELFPNIKIYDYNCGLLRNEIELLTKTIQLKYKTN